MIQKEDLIRYKPERSGEAIDEARLLAKHGHWNTVASQLYYVVNALLISSDLDFKTHSGVKSLFHENYIINKKIGIEYGSLYNILFNLRQMGDYEAFQVFTEQDILPYLSQTENFLSIVKNHLQK